MTTVERGARTGPAGGGSSRATRMLRVLDGSRRSQRNAQEALAQATDEARRSLAVLRAFEAEYGDATLAEARDSMRGGTQPH